MLALLLLFNLFDIVEATVTSYIYSYKINVAETIAFAIIYLYLLLSGGLKLSLK